MRFASLLLFALSTLNAATPGFFNVTDYGAKNDGSARATDAIRSAIQACAKAGGGTVYFPAGTYETGPIELVSNLVLHVDAGATLRFISDPSAYPPVPGRYEGTETLTPAPLIGGRNLENVTITGRGTLMADNAAWRKATANPEARAAWTDIQQRLERKETVPEADYRKAVPMFRPSFIRPMDSKNILIEGIHIIGSSMWTLHILYCENVVIRNVIVDTYNGGNSDGVDIDSSREVRISDSYFNTGDDGICLKSGKDADGRRVNRPTENVTITNCTIRHAHGAVVLGSETAGSIRNVVASNIISRGTDKGIRIKSGRGRGGTIENVRFDNWIIEDVPTAIEVTNYYTKVPDEPVSDRTPIFRNIAIDNITINRAQVAVSIEGLPEMPIDGLRLSNVTGNAKAGLRAFNTEGLELHNLLIDATNGPAYLIRQSKNLELSHLESHAANGEPVIRLDRCPGALVRETRVWPNTKTYLSLAPGEKAGTHYEGADNVVNTDSTADYWKDIKSPDKLVSATKR